MLSVGKKLKEFYSVDTLELKISNILREKWGFDSFRSDQKDIIKAVLNKKCVLALMPTGMGKSLCFLLPTFINEGVTVVISPLIALMQDQVDKARKLGLSATYLASTLSSEERHSRYEKIGNGFFKLIYVTPERFRKSEFLENISKLKVSLLAVDEAHCISMWGHDFRPDYSRLGQFREKLGNPPTLALTATATQAVQKDIVESLKLNPVESFHGGVDRPNLHLRVHDVYGDDEKIRGIFGLRHFCPGPAIIYFSLISTLQKFSDQLGRMNLHHVIYHGQLPGDLRKKNQRAFIEGKVDLILATPAFGLGIDKKDVRLLIHAEIPSSIEAYYQEYGRAGRDGKESECHLFFDQDDISIQLEFLKWGNPEPSFVEKVYDLVEENSARLQSEGVDFLREQMNFYNRRDYRAEASLNILERMDCLERNPKTKLGYRAIRRPEVIELSQKEYEVKMKSLNSKLLQMVQLIQMEEGCRTQEVYQYFGFSSNPCGKCDLCQKANLGKII